jgi:putative heme iron utilization protein
MEGTNAMDETIVKRAQKPRPGDKFSRAGKTLTIIRIDNGEVEVFRQFPDGTGETDFFNLQRFPELAFKTLDVPGTIFTAAL